MENATKALLIAAAVLVAIIIISLGIALVNNGISSGESATGELNSVEIAAFNKKYENSEGVRSGSTVRTILTYAINDNQESLGEGHKTAAIDKTINIRSNDPEILNKFKSNSSMTTALNGTRNYGVRYAENIAKIREAVNVQKKYKIWFSYNKSGYIWEIHIDAP